MKRFLISLLIIFVSCAQNNHSIKTSIEKELGLSMVNGIVLIISENNCISCFENNLYSWIDFADTANYSLYALFLHKKNYSVEFRELINNTKMFIRWKDTKSLELFEKLSKTTKQYSPFVVIIKNNKIDYIDKLIPAEYYINTKDEEK